MTILVDRQQYKIWIAGIDAPSQPHDWYLHLAHFRE